MQIDETGEPRKLVLTNYFRGENPPRNLADPWGLVSSPGPRSGPRRAGRLSRPRPSKVLLAHWAATDLGSPSPRLRPDIADAFNAQRVAFRDVQHLLQKQTPRTLARRARRLAEYPREYICPTKYQPVSDEISHPFL